MSSSIDITDVKHYTEDPDFADRHLQPVRRNADGTLAINGGGVERPQHDLDDEALYRLLASRTQH